jgi:hypothetical protein
MSYNPNSGGGATWDSVTGKPAVITNTTASFTTAQETKLAGIATAATVNDTDANLRARSTHTGSQAASTISDFNTAADARVTAGLAGYATTAAVAAGYQPLDTQLTSLAGLSYSGNGSKVVRVNAGETAFELATPSGGGGDPLDAWPVGSVFISVVSTNPATLLGGGTWVAFGAGRVLVGLDTGDADFDTEEETGGAKTSSAVVNHTHAVTITDPGHAHTQTTSATDGAAGRADSSSGGTQYTNVANINSNTTGITASTANPAGGVSSFSLVQPYIVVRMWKRTA